MPRAKRSPAAQKTVKIGGLPVSNRHPLILVAGLCVLESPRLLARVGAELKRVFAATRTRWVLKCSFDKANRSSGRSFRGTSLAEALEVFARVKADLKVPMLTDVHEPWQAYEAARVVDVLQIPAFLCRQTDLLLAAGRTGRVVNIKKGQFLSPENISNAVAKVESTGNRRIILTERGVSFGYGNLVVDMRSLKIMAQTGYPVIFDATHSCQLPGALGAVTGGQREFVPPLARAAAAVGVAGIFLETHPRPDQALSDAANTIRLKDMPRLARSIVDIDRLIKKRTRRT